MSEETLLSNLLPDLARKARIHREKAAALGIPVVFTAGWRSPAEQLALFTKGRAFNATEGIWHVVDPKRIVTNATADHAPHCRGAAYDLVPLVNEKAAWDRLDLFAKLGELGKELGLVWGGDWPKLKDCPHFELPNWRGMPLLER